MELAIVIAVALAAGATLFLAAAGWQIRRRHMDRWLPAYFRERERYQAPKAGDEIHVILCIADHYEPKAAKATPEQARQRVATWVEQYPKQFGQFKDSDGRTPRHTFFFPIDEYEREHVEALVPLCRAGFGEIEIHLHHHDDTPEGLRSKLLQFKDIFANEHGVLSRHRETGEVMYAFIHGNWALCNSRPDGAWCGVDNELQILVETGCYVDMTFPSAPSPTQPPIINHIYYACDRPGRRRSHEIPLQENEAKDNALLMVQGPLLLDWSKRKWGFWPSVENACLQTSQPPTLDRLWNWLQAHVQVPHRGDWYFVKLHAHGAEEHDHEALLGAPMVRFHQDLAKLAQDHANFHYHYVTAREMVNLIKAAQAGHKGSVAEALDWELVSNVSSEPAPQKSLHIS